MNPSGLRVFALGASRALGEAVAQELGVWLSAHEEREFEDGEHKVRPLESVRGCDVHVLHSLYADESQSVNDKLCRLLFFAAALRDAGAAGVTAVLPYLCYARKDHRTKARDPVTTRSVARMIEAVGVDRVVTIDVHNEPAYENAFRIPAEHLAARRLFVRHFAEALRDEPVCVASPDVGGIRRAERLADELSRALGRPVTTAFMLKRRSEGQVSGGELVGECAGRVTVLVDDIVASGTTLSLATEALLARGARAVHAAATHGIFSGSAPERLARLPLASLVVTDTIPPRRLDRAWAKDHLVVLGGGPLLAETIRRLHERRPLAELVEP